MQSRVASNFGIIAPSDQPEADPVMTAFLGFLAKDIAAAPGRIKPLAATRIKEARDLTRRVKVRDDDTLPDDVTL
jgi:prlF antitoxin for toxin YhaV_toxin